MSTAPLHSIKIGGVLFSSKRSEDGEWERDGKPMPWVCLTPWPRHGGASLRIGPWMFGVMWIRQNQERKL
jgi:hypothetical protein